MLEVLKWREKGRSLAKQWANHPTTMDEIRDIYLDQFWRIKEGPKFKQKGLVNGDNLSRAAQRNSDLKAVWMRDAVRFLEYIKTYLK